MAVAHFQALVQTHFSAEVEIPAFPRYGKGFLDARKSFWPSGPRASWWNHSFNLECFESSFIFEVGFQTKISRIRTGIEAGLSMSWNWLLSSRQDCGAPHRYCLVNRWRFPKFLLFCVSSLQLLAYETPYLSFWSVWDECLSHILNHTLQELGEMWQNLQTYSWNDTRQSFAITSIQLRSQKALILFDEKGRNEYFPQFLYYFTLGFTLWNSWIL